MDLVTIKIYGQKYEAEMDAELLENNGIATILVSDDCGGTRPGLSFSGGCQLRINGADLEKAKKLLF